MVWAGISYGQCTNLHFIDGNLNAQRYRDEILAPIVAPYVQRHHVTFQQDNARPHVAIVCTDFLHQQNIQVLNWPPYSPDMSPIEHLRDVLDRRVQRRNPAPQNIQQLRQALQEEWDNIPQAEINHLLMSMRRRCVALRDANGGHTPY